MATMSGSATGFIGNDFTIPSLKKQEPKQRRHYIVLPSVEPKAIVKEPVLPSVTNPLVIAEPFEEEMPELAVSPAVALPAVTTVTATPPTFAPRFDEVPEPAQRSFKKFSLPTNTRKAAIVIVVIVMVTMTSVALLKIAQSSHVSALGKSFSSLTHGNSDQLPANSILVHTNQLSSNMDAIESQAISINTGSSTLVPMPIDIANWVKTSAGTQSGTTELTIKTSSIESYIKKNASNASASSVSHAVNQITKILFNCNGATINL